MAEVFADVIVDISDTGAMKTFQYHVPDGLTGKAEPGCVVTVPFGRGGRTVSGWILSLSDQPKIERERIRDIQDIPDNRVSAEAGLVSLAIWICRTYGSGLNNALKTVLPVRDKKKETTRERITLAVSEEEAEKIADACEKKHQTAKVRLLRELIRGGHTDRTDAASRLKVTRPTVDSLIREGVICTDVCTEWRGMEEEDEGPAAEEPVLSEEQSDVLQGIFSEWQHRDRPSLILGVTGSGKTMVYMKLIEEVLQEGKQAIVLIPEIALSWQNVSRFRRHFGDRVTVMNSRMSDGEKSDQYERMRRGEAKIVIGPRSALFAPFPRLGLIIVDEEQETSYRSGSAPRYDARETAVERGRLEHAHVVFGSATPSVDAYYRCRQGSWALFRLDSRYGGAAMPDVKIIDMRAELKQGNRSILSRKLRDGIEDRLSKNEQTLLFLNRRGVSGFISCRSCGEVISCPHCSVSLTLHGNGTLVCHYCGYTIKAPDRCPSCGSPYIGGFRAGTERVEAELKRYFPSARVLRMDADTTKTKESYREILKTFAEHGADILVGTQMIIKGHDFPAVTLVGALAADLSLFAEDYRAAEHTYQLVVQAAGRAGRGTLPGEALIQTYHPDHYSLKAAVEQDYDAFYEEEIATRELLGYPPASQLLAVHGSGRDEERLASAMHHLLLFLQKYAGEVTILGPAPETVARVKDVYREVLYVKTASEQRAIAIRKLTESYIEINRGFDHLAFQYDLNA